MILARFALIGIFAAGIAPAFADEPTPAVPAVSARQGPPGGLSGAPTPPAAAAEQPAAIAAATVNGPKPPRPCERSAMRLKLAGMDPDVTRCQVFLLGQQIADSTTQATALAAQNLLDKKDSDEVATNAAAREKQWADYFAAYIGATPAPAPTR